MPPLFIPVSVCKELVDVTQVLDRVEQSFRWEAAGLVRYAEPGTLRMTSEQPPAKFHSKAVVLPELGIAGFRVVGYRLHEDGSGPSSPDSTRLIILTDLETGSPVAIVDEHYNYTLRTAASIGVAARHLCPERPVLGLIGAGGVAHDVARIFLHCLPLQAVLVTSRRAESRERLVEAARGWSDVPVTATANLDAVLERSNLLVTATTVREPLIAADRLRPGMTLCALGSFELAPELYRRVDKLVVDDWRQTSAAHDVRPLIEQGVVSQADVFAEVAQIVAGESPGRERPEETILVRTEGMASQDVALAHWVYQEAVRKGLGTQL